ncbi:MAG TPA: hypothetical protein VJY85_03680, partial [Candidatus Limnocylindria bacterium]|nr:hypothetical protein [Candidatus Limnocylindria bacterium]
LNTHVVAAHTHDIIGGGAHAHNVSAAANHTHSINDDGAHTHTVALGGGNQPLDIRQPYATVTKIIYAGSQAAPAAATAAVPLVRRLMSAPMRGAH